MGEALLELASPVEAHGLASARLLKIFASLPLEILHEIVAFGRQAPAPGALHLRNLPLDPWLPATPTDGMPSQEKQTFVAEGVLLGLTFLLGAPFAVPTEKRGLLIHDVVPVASGATSQTNQGSRVALQFHNDLVFDESRLYNTANPDFVVLVCLRQDPARTATTYYADARDIVAGLSASTLDVLRAPEFRLNAPGGYVRDYAAGSEVLSNPTPLVLGPEATPEICLAANGVRPLTPRAIIALDELYGVCAAVSHETRLAPGEALLLDNRKGVHARSCFEARHDGGDRWVQRTYVRRDMWPLRQHHCYPPDVEDRRLTPRHASA